ncbi:transglycosylase family protein [Streptomyces sp. NPDC057638]|uniref:transglycosylase family protein n=1 Tax=Streptomyces sp. NPDC057638 TaxID=3346190 RepID=UPI00368273CE
MPALVVAAGVTGSAIALPLLGAGSATAAESTTWDRVAECESGGLWSADTGNGYYGGLQLSQKTWEEFGGDQYASRADLASRSQQIAVAEKVLAARGAEAWAACAKIAGLPLPGESGKTGTPDGAEKPATGGTGTGDQDSKADKAESTDKADKSVGADVKKEKEKKGEESPSSSPASPSPARTESQSPAPSTAPTQGVGSGADRDPAAGTGKHRGQPAPEGTTPEGATPDPSATAPEAGTGTPAEGTDGADGTDSTSGVDDRAADAGHASRGGGGARDGAPGGVGGGTEGAEGAAPGGKVSPSSYTVRSGDSLWGIAEREGADGGWVTLYEKNKKVVGDDPDLIHPGQKLDLSVS